MSPLGCRTFNGYYLQIFKTAHGTYLHSEQMTAVITTIPRSPSIPPTGPQIRASLPLSPGPGGGNRVAGGEDGREVTSVLSSDNWPIPVSSTVAPQHTMSASSNWDLTEVNA